jgi:hypothetical protein
MCREIGRQTAMYLARNLIGQDLTIPAFEGVESRPHDFSGELFGASTSRARSVSMKPACSPTTWVPCCASSRRRPLVSAQAADFDAP